MRRKVILNLAMSLDGFIADESGGYSWIKGDGVGACDTAIKYDFKRFLEEIDTVVMGRKCYDQGMHRDFQDKKVYIASKMRRAGDKNVIFSDDICRAVREEQEKEGKHIYLFGGGEMLDGFLREDIIDEYIVGIIPVILGSGRPLFLHGTPKINLRLRGCFIGIKRFVNGMETAVLLCIPSFGTRFYKEESVRKGSRSAG